METIVFGSNLFIQTLNPTAIISQFHLLTSAGDVLMISSPADLIPPLTVTISLYYTNIDHTLSLIIMFPQYVQHNVTKYRLQYRHQSTRQGRREVVRLTIEGAWQIHWCACARTFIVGNGRHGNYSYTRTIDVYACTYASKGLGTRLIQLQIARSIGEPSEKVVWPEP